MSKFVILSSFTYKQKYCVISISNCKDQRKKSIRSRIGIFQHSQNKTANYSKSSSRFVVGNHVSCTRNYNKFQWTSMFVPPTFDFFIRRQFGLILPYFIAQDYLLIFVVVPIFSFSIANIKLIFKVIKPAQCADFTDQKIEIALVDEHGEVTCEHKF